MKKLLALLLLAALPLAAQNTTLQKTPSQPAGSNANKLTDPSKVIVVGDGGSISATGTGQINATSVAGGSISPTAPLTGGGPISGTVVIGIPKATSSVDGYLFHTDWATFNAKQAAGNYLTALTGDASAAGPGSSALIFATVNANVGSFGDATHVGAFTVNAKGLVTAASSVAIAIPSTAISDSSATGRSVLTGATQAANLVFAGPSSGSAAAPTFRSLVAADLPSLSGTYLTRANNLSDVASVSSSAHNLGLGTADSPTFVAVNVAAVNATGTLTLTPGSTSNVLIGGTSNQVTRLDAGVGPTPSPSPAAAYFQPVVWGSGSRYYLDGGYTLWTTPSYPSGQYDYLGGIGYNMNNTAVAGDVQFGLGFESLFQNDPNGADTEFYYAWNGPAGVTPSPPGRTGRRVWQSNASWGFQQHASHEMGWVNFNWDVNFFGIYNGSSSSNPALTMDLGDNTGTASTYQFHWFGTNAARFEGGISTTNYSTNVSTGNNTFGGQTLITAANATYQFDTGNDSVLEIGNAVHDVAIKFWRNNVGGTQWMNFGGGSGGSIFGASSAYQLDMVGNTASAANEFDVRYSANSGSTFTTMMRIRPDKPAVAFGPSVSSIDLTGAHFLVADTANLGSTVNLNYDYTGNGHQYWSVLPYTADTSKTALYLQGSGYSAPGTANYLLLGDTGTTTLNAPTTMALKIANGNAFSMTSSGVTLSASTASTSPSTGALTTNGGVGALGSIQSAGTVGSYQNDGTATKAFLSGSGNSGALTLTSAGVGNFRYIDFNYGATPTLLWRFGYAGAFPNTWIGFYNQSIGGAVMVTPNNNLLVGNTSTDMSGTYNLALEGGVIDTRTTAAIVLKQNGTTALTIANSTLNATFASTTDTSSPSTGGAVFSGGVGIAKALSVGSTTDAFSSITGAETIAGGLGVAKALYVGTTINAATSVTSPSFVGALTGTASTATALATARTLWGQSFDGTGNVSGSLTGVGNITGGASSMTITAGTGNSRTLALQSTTSGGTATTFLTGNADQSVTFVGAVSGITTHANTGNMTISGTSSVLAMAGTTEASTGGAGSINTAGGIFAAKKIVTTSTLQVSSGSTTPLDISATGANAFIAMNADQATFLSSVGPDPATVGTQTKDSVYLALRGSYWTGSAAQSVDCAIINEVVSTAPLYKLAFRTSNTDRLTMDNAGLIAALVATDATSSTAAAFTITGGLGVAKKLYAGDDIHGIGNVLIDTAGKTLSIKSGSNAAAGTVTLVAGAATITSTAIDANTVILFSEKTAGGTPGVYQPLASVSSGSAAVTSAATDISTYNWVALKVN